jgi:hypothetical protein
MITVKFRENEATDAVRSVENHVRDILFNTGMFSAQIDAIIPLIKQEIANRISVRAESAKSALDAIAAMKPEEEQEPYEIRWEASEDHYDDRMYNLLIHITKPVVYKWIEENKPGAWFKEMFNPNSK